MLCQWLLLGLEIMLLSLGLEIAARWIYFGCSTVGSLVGEETLYWSDEGVEGLTEMREKC